MSWPQGGPPGSSQQASSSAHHIVAPPPLFTLSRPPPRSNLAPSASFPSRIYRSNPPRSVSSSGARERLTESVNAAAAELAEPTGLSFHVRFSDSGHEDVLDLLVGERETVRDVKRRVAFRSPFSARLSVLV